MQKFVGRLQFDFGDFTEVTNSNGNNINLGRYASLLSEITWINGDISITIPKNTITDGASIPFFVEWLLPKWGDISTIAAVLHDYLLDCIIDGNPCKGLERREDCDWQYFIALLSLNKPIWIAFPVWLGVRLNSICYELIKWPPQRSEYAQWLMDKLKEKNK